METTWSACRGSNPLPNLVAKTAFSRAADVNMCAPDSFLAGKWPCRCADYVSGNTRIFSEKRKWGLRPSACCTSHVAATPWRSYDGYAAERCGYTQKKIATGICGKPLWRLIVPGGIRTHNLRLRRPTLYPIELPRRGQILQWILMLTIIGKRLEIFKPYRCTV